MPLVTSENREEFIKSEMAKKAGKNPVKKTIKKPKTEGEMMREKNTHKNLGNDYSKMNDEDLAKEIAKYDAMQKQHLKNYMKEHGGSIPLSEYKKDDPEFSDFKNKYMGLLIEQGYRKK
jgi:hypothetical protein